MSRNEGTYNKQESNKTNKAEGSVFWQLLFNAFSGKTLSQEPEKDVVIKKDTTSKSVQQEKSVPTVVYQDFDTELSIYDWEYIKAIYCDSNSDLVKQEFVANACTEAYTTFIPNEYHAWDNPPVYGEDYINSQLANNNAKPAQDYLTQEWESRKHWIIMFYGYTIFMFLLFLLAILVS